MTHRVVDAETLPATSKYSRHCLPLPRWFSSSAWLPMLAAVIFPILLFREHVFALGSWIGNSDRLNSNLKVLTFFLRGISGGHLSAWNEHEMLGYDAFTLPYTFPNPLTLLSGFGGLQNLTITAGYISVALLIFAGLAAYYFLRSLNVSTSAAMVGVALYQLTALPILKVSQNDASFLVFILIPTALRLVRQVSRQNLLLFFASMVALLFAMLHVMFLQKAAYALMLCGSYAAWRSYAQRIWLPLIYFCGATIVAILLASPRLIGIAIAMVEYARVVGDHSLLAFADVYRFQNILPHQILRWLDPTILGISQSDPVALKDNINLSEGFLLGNSVAVPLLLCIGIAHRNYRSTDLLHRNADDFAFWIWALSATISVILWKLPLEVLYYAFGKLDFTHARILIAGLSALVAAVAVLLTRYKPRGNMRLGTIAIGIAATSLALFCIEYFVAHQAIIAPIVQLPWTKHVLLLRADATLRAVCTILLCSGLLAGLFRSKHAMLQQLCYVAFCSIIIGQTFLAADTQVNGVQTHNQATPFHKGDMFMAHRDQFLLPSAEQISRLGNQVNSREQRVILICDPTVAGGFCAGHIPEAWQLRAVDGYYGLGVPRRIRALPWTNAIGLRTLSFTSLEGLNWPLLGLLNVGNVIEVTPELFENWTQDAAPADPAHIKIIPNPARVTPRAFLVKRIEPVDSPEAAVRELISNDQIRSPEQTSFVEGIAAPQRFAATGPIAVRGANDTLTLDVSATHGQRFLVVNELFFPGWHAYVDGNETAIYPTNSFMRGIFLSESAHTVTLHYQPFVATQRALYLYLSGLILFGGGMILCYRFAR